MEVGDTTVSTTGITAGFSSSGGGSALIVIFFGLDGLFSSDFSLGLFKRMMEWPVGVAGSEISSPPSGT